MNRRSSGKLTYRIPTATSLARNFETVKFPITSSPRARPSNWVNAALYSYMIVAVSLHRTHICVVKRTLSPYFRNLPLLHITIRLHLTSRLLKFMQWLARKQYVLVVGNAI